MTDLLQAFAASDLATLRAACREDVVVYGTDEGETWSGLEPLLEALDGMRELRLEARWLAPPATGPGWLAGVAEYRGAALAPTEVRVTMVFDGDLLAHAHFSVSATLPG